MGEVRRRRPWLAVLLALVISGLGHAYLRRWGRALGWYVAITVTLVVLVPDAAVDQLFAGTAPPLADLLPALAVVLASVVDAYVLAIRNNREYERQAEESDRGVGHDQGVDQERGIGHDQGVDQERDGRSEPAATADSWSGDDSSAARTTAENDAFEPDTAADPETETKPTPVECPNCGRETDPEIDFCHWCTEPLPGSDESEPS